jgi:antitoxin ParD1/3/4
MKSQTNLNVSLTPRFMDMVRRQVRSGRYQSASEVVRDGLRLLEERDRQQEAFWADVRKKVAEAKAEIRAGKGIPGDVARAQMEEYMRKKQAERKEMRSRNGATRK